MKNFQSCGPPPYRLPLPLFNLTSVGGVPLQNEQKKLSTVKNSIDLEKILSFEYLDINGNLSSRNLEPYSLILKVNQWYVYGFCQLRKDFRLFKLGRMFKLTVLESELFSNVEVKEYQYQPYTNRDFVTLTLKFTQHALNQLENYFEFEGMVFEEDGWIYITETFPEDGWIYRLLLSLGDHVEVLKPQHIRNKLKDMAKRIFEIY